MLGLSIQIRILRSVKEAERGRRAEQRALIGMLSAREERTEGLGLSGMGMGASESALTDTEDLRALIRAALRAGSDAEIFRLLQIGREEMPEAVKTLQRALERVVGGAGSGTGAGKKEKEKKRWGIGMGRGRTRASSSSSSPLSSGASASPGSEKDARTSVDADGTTDTWGTTPDALDREFIESGIDALRRMSRGAGMSTSSLPPWTITRYEVDREQKIGVGFFSDVYRGTWRGRTVAIKVLAPTTPRALFVREVQVWRALRHPGVLRLFGASSACGERPWFFVCAYMRRGSLVEFLKRVEMGAEGAAGAAGASGRVVFPIWEEGRAGRHEGDLYRFMLEIAQGMEYLHGNGVLHGDLKAANVLVDDDVHCVISDFGQSEMKSEAYRISGTAPPRGTLRWQAPELMSGESQLALTSQMDVYAYAILCVEIVAMGKLPWPLADDEAVRHFVLRENTRPALPFSRFNTPQLQDLLRVCWHHDPSVRPPFAAIVRDVKALRRAFLSDAGEESPVPVSSPIAIDRSRQASEWEWGEHARTRPSPDMRPLPLPHGTPRMFPRLFHWRLVLTSISAATDSVLTTGHGVSPDSSYGTFVTAEENLSPGSPFKAQAGVLHHREDAVSSDHVRMPMPMPVVYTHSGTPDSPSVASSLFSHTPSSSSLDELGLTTPGRPVSVAEVYESPALQDERINLMRDERRDTSALGAIAGQARRRGVSAQAGGKVYHVVQLFLAGKESGQRGAWIAVAVRVWAGIVREPAPSSEKRSAKRVRCGCRLAYVQRQERLDVVAHFNVFSAPRNGEPWGTFTTDTEVPHEMGGPSYDEPIPGHAISSSKVSRVGVSWETVLIARLRFKPDVLEPTSL
ncbi:hypothetical protein C0993_002387 [Termitomyces sp. T159_Od127]|nr:hypothetical protein C0993_002387 [Termitomyces sp. T159_Od127]